MRLLVTGGLGFIGSNLILYLLGKHRNIKIINLDKMGIGSNINNLKDIEGNERYSLIKGRSPRL
jgi:dTDP-glucose 4,6-dehydratase